MKAAHVDHIGVIQCNSNIIRCMKAAHVDHIGVIQTQINIRVFSKHFANLANVCM